MFTIIIIGPIMELTSGGGASQDPRETTIELELRSRLDSIVPCIRYTRFDDGWLRVVLLRACLCCYSIEAYMYLLPR